MLIGLNCVSFEDYYGMISEYGCLKLPNGACHQSVCESDRKHKLDWSTSGNGTENIAVWLREQMNMEWRMVVGGSVRWRLEAHVDFRHVPSWSRHIPDICRCR